jgi:hypothetical protein
VDAIDFADSVRDNLHRWSKIYSAYRFQGRDFRLTDVAGNVVAKLLA